ncbi:flavodoxin domain-containing protein [Kitasatospora sp. RG8]|uniref:flavodoxin domain-containing protein n=1 Tax=Kitasatospora sp. RG8 TaxID=2820815 RepID=UPI001ADFBCDC|nr:flavodoxin domain-containing protein [Kitasatospora sp. RG8]MBP0450599.1 flavodoxin domain-containing protein [Kitasatospora sp. RG8]
MRILVGYASEHGSTRGIAERIAAGLSRHGHHVVVASLVPLGPSRGPEATELEDLDAAVLGSAVHDGRWLSAALEFTRRNADALAGLPVWLFSVSLLGERGSAFHPFVAKRLRALRAAHRSPQPDGLRSDADLQDHHDFSGAVESEHWPFPGRVAFRLMGGRYGDHRDWADIDRWTESIARRLASGP